MHSVGVVKVEDRLRWALVRGEKKGLFIEKLGEGLSLPEEILSIKNISIVTGLAGSEVLRRDLSLPLTSLRMVAKALPFQLEPLLPMPLDCALVFPQYYTSAKETFVVVWIALKETLDSHLQHWQSIGIDPDIVSCEPLAIARWGRFLFPDQPELAISYQTQAIVLSDDKVVCAIQSPDTLRLQQFVKQKFPLFNWVGAPSSRDQWSPEELYNYAPAIGLALEYFEKKGCQFRTSSFISTRKKRSQRRQLIATLGAGLGLIFLTAAMSLAILSYQEHQLKKQLAPFCLATGPLIKTVEHFRQQLIRETKAAALVPNIPTVQDVLAWLSTFPPSVDLHHIEYDLFEYPKENLAPYRARLSLEFRAETPDAADRFVKQLQQAPSLIGSTHELKWTSSPQDYKLSFLLSKNE